MANRRNYRVQSAGRTAMRSNETYIYGNTVRKLDTVPQQTPEQPQKKSVSHQVRQNRKQALSMTTAYTMFLAVATVATLMVCVWYLQLRFELTEHSANIAAMEQQIADLKEENTTRENAILDAVNLEVVRQHATEDLGMKYVQQDQIITYQNPAGDYVKQYEKIPESGILK